MISRLRLSNKNSSFCKSMGTGLTSSQIVFFRFRRLSKDFSSFTSFQNNFTVFLFLAMRVFSSELFDAVDANDGVGDELFADRQWLSIGKRDPSPFELTTESEFKRQLSIPPGGGGGGRGGPLPNAGGGRGGGGIGDPVVQLSKEDTDSTSVSSSGFRSEKSRSLMCSGRRCGGAGVDLPTASGLRMSSRVMADLDS